MVEIIAHRGFWNSRIQQNSKEAIKNALNEGFSIETDIRDYDGSKIGISHDPINFDSNCKFTFQEYLEIVDNHSDKKTKSFLNIKSDGLENILNNFDCLKNNPNFIFFDGSFPSMIRLKENNFFCLDRISEFEEKSGFKFDGYWIDCFKYDWMINNESTKFNDDDFLVYVSPELHNRPHKKVWEWIKNASNTFDCKFALCTDFPLEARNFFND